MRIGDIYKHKKYSKFIRIEGFAKRIDKPHKLGFIIVYNNLEDIDGYLGSCPTFMGFALDEKQIESNYELYIKGEDITWENHLEINQQILEEINMEEE